MITDQAREQAMRQKSTACTGIKERRASSCRDAPGKTQIGLCEALSCEGEEIVVVEGGPDLLAALAYFGDCGVICMPSAQTDFCGVARRELARRKVLVIPHADEAGMKALARWEQQLGRKKADTAWIELDHGANDFNEWLSASST